MPPREERRATAYGEIRISGGDTDRPINLAHRLRLIERHVQLAGRKVIDCGCGSGGYVSAFGRKGADAHGIEFEERKVRLFAETSTEPHRVRVGNLEHIDFPDNTFDFALLNEVLEHVPDERKALSEILRILKPDGVLAVFSPNRTYPFETHGVNLKRLGRRIAPHSTFLVPYVPLPIGERIFDYPARNYFPWQLSRRLEEAGFRITHRTWLWQTFENISGHQPLLIRLMRPLLRRVAWTLERTPGLRVFGASQVIFAAKPQDIRRTGP